MKHVFVDSGGFFAHLVSEDALHTRATELFARAEGEGWHLVTPNAVVYDTHALPRGLRPHLPQPAVRLTGEPLMVAEGGAETPERSLGAHVTAFVGRSMRLRGILNDRQTVTCRQLEDWLEIGRIAVKVHRTIALVRGVMARAICLMSIV